MRTVLAIAALLVTAGCLGAPGVDGSEQTPDDGFPPGVTADGVENASALVDAHDAALSDDGYAFRVEMTGERAGNGSYEGRTRDGVFRLQAEYSRNGEPLTVDTWANATVELTRMEHDGETRFDQRQRGAEREPWTEQLGHALDVGEFAVTDRYVDDGRTLLELEANSTRPARQDAFESFDGRVVVDLDGRVHELDTTTVVASDSGPWTRTTRFEIADVGVDAVERPDWSDQAAATISASLSLDADRDHVVLTHDAGDPLPEGTTVELTHDDETHTLTFDRSLDAGEQAYLAYPADGGAPVLTFEEPSGEFERIEGGYEVSVTGPDGAAILNAGFAVGTGSDSATAD